jgi:hypothetical protein
MKQFYSEMFRRTGGAMVPHAERFESAGQGFRDEGAMSFPAPAEAFGDEDAEFDRGVLAGLRGLYEEFYAPAAADA